MAALLKLRNIQFRFFDFLACGFPKSSRNATAIKFKFHHGESLFRSSRGPCLRCHKEHSQRQPARAKSCASLAAYVLEASRAFASGAVNTDFCR